MHPFTRKSLLWILIAAPLTIPATGYAISGPTARVQKTVVTAPVPSPKAEPTEGGVRLKYGPRAVPLSRDRGYLAKAPAPDFWALMPYYVPQQDGASCSVASTAAVVNAARASRKQTSEDRLATQSELLEKVKGKGWSTAFGRLTSGVTLEQLGSVLEASLTAYGVEVKEVEIKHLKDTSPASLELLRKDLSENEKSTEDFIVANFLQSVLTGDPEGGGHVAPIAGYDAKAKRVLILDPDREWYEPYWVSDASLAEAMATVDRGSGLTRGYVVVRIRK